MKKIFASMMAAAMVVALAGCSNNTSSTSSTTSDNSSAAESNSAAGTAENSSAAGTTETSSNAGTAESGADDSASTGANKLGMGVVTSTASSSAGNAQVDATVAAVILDADGKIVSCKLDVAQNKMAVEDGEVPEDAASMTFKSKKEKLEEYKKMSVAQMRSQLHDDFRNNQLIQQMREKLVSDIAVTPADVRKYFNNMPEDSIPLVPTQVEVEIITKQPKISQDEINHVKNDLREYTDRVNNGETSFATLARLYSEDPGSARQGGEMDYVGRGMLDPAFAAVAFNLTDPKRVSKIVESEYGFHIIQLIDKRGDKIKVRHILRIPRVSAEATDSMRMKLDSLAADIRADKLSFEEAATVMSDDKETRNNHGLMSFNSEEGRTSKFQMKDLPTEVARKVERMEVGDVSDAFPMVNEKGKHVVAIVKLKNRIAAHRATINEDFQVLQNVVLQKQRAEFLHNWVVKKIKTTYVRMQDRYKNYKYEYEGWVK